MKKLGTKTLTAAAIGAGVMYFFDPENGRRRRAILRDKTMSQFRKMNRTAGQRSRYIAGKAEGVKHHLTPRPDAQAPNDATLQHKIESEALGNYPKGHINVNVEDGAAVLRGTLDTPDEINALVEDVRHISGVVEVRSLLHLPGTPAPSHATATRTPQR